MPRRDYQAKLDADNAGVLEASRSVRDIAPGYPGPGDLEIRAACERDFRLFCETYFPRAFNLEWSADHLKVIARMEDVILTGGLFALAMPRGSGKSTLSMRAALWALLYGHRRFVCLVGATEEAGKRLLKDLKTELMYNDRLGRDFRQVCYPIRRLENNGRKAIGQIYNGEQTNIDWGKDRLTFPTMPPEACDGVNVSGYTVTVAGLTGALRGQSHTLPTGEIIRPEVAILDDPQTRGSAMSLTQSETRTAIIKGDVLGMAGPGQDIAVIVPCTVIRSGDMADRLLDRKQNPEWSGQLTKMVYAFPKNEKLWEEYKQVRDDALNADRGEGEATEFYRAHRAEMDEGAVVAWPARHKPTELSAVQCAMNIKLWNPYAFAAEYQNEPLPEDDHRGDELTSDQIVAKINRMKRGEVPVACQRLTAFIDVHQTVLYYAVCAWEDDFTGAVVDYGTYPDQRRAYFSLRDSKHTLQHVIKNAGLEGQIYGGLAALTDLILGREWPRDDGAGMKAERCVIDANWGVSTAVVKKFCRESAHAAVLTPSHGKAVGASYTPMAEWPKRAGEKAGHNWRLRSMEDSRGVRSLLFDTNYWKAFVSSRLATAMGDRGGLALFGDKPEAHRLFADHLCSEYRIKTEGRGRTVDEFRIRPERPDNHWWDCLVGCAVAASMQGVSLPESGGPPSAGGPRKRVSFADLKNRKRA